MMSLATMETIVRKALEEAEQFCCFGFQGGEPTLVGLEFYEKVIEFQEKYNHKQIKIVNTIQTNGLLIDDVWARFFAENHFLVGLSIDGAKDTHDSLRFDASGKGTFNACLKAAKTLTANKAEFNILSVVTRQLAAHPDNLWNFYKKNGFRHIQFIPCLDRLHEPPGNNHYSLNEKTFGKFLIRFFDLWYRDFTQGDYYSVRVFDNYVRMLMGGPPETCGMAGQCQAYSLIEADGSVYPCDFYALDEYKLGDIHSSSFSELLNGAVAWDFVEASKIRSEECRSCLYYFICRAGCRRDREPFHEGVPVLNRHCGAYQAFFAHALAPMREIAQHLSRRR